MEYQKNLLNNDEKSVWRVILGIIFIVISISWIVSRYLENIPLRVFDWVYFATFSLNGVFNIFEGIGKSMDRFLGKAFIHIDDQAMVMKPRILKKRKKLTGKTLNPFTTTRVNLR